MEVQIQALGLGYYAEEYLANVSKLLKKMLEWHLFLG
jgi:hypothetical protein